MSEQRKAARLILTVCLAATACRTGADAVWIGVAGHLDGTEGARENLRGVLLAVEHVNAQGGVFGKPVRIVARDDGGYGDVAAHIAQELLNDPRISVVVGHTTSASMLAAAPIYDQGLPAIATTASAPALSGISPWVFRTISSDSVTGARLARFAWSHGWRTAAILYQNDVYGRGLADAFAASYQGRLVSRDPIAVDATDFSVDTRYYARFTPDVIFVIAGRGAVPVQLRGELARRKLRVGILASEGATGLERAAVGVNEIYVSAPFSRLETDPGSNQFVQDFVKRFGHPPKHDAALAYDAMITACAALRAVGPDRARIRRYLADIDSTHAPIGATGRVYFDVRGDRRDAHGVLLKIDGGRAVIVLNATD